MPLNKFHCVYTLAHDDAVRSDLNKGNSITNKSRKKLKL